MTSARVHCGRDPIARLTGSDYSRRLRPRQIEHKATARFPASSKPAPCRPVTQAHGYSILRHHTKYLFARWQQVPAQDTPQSVVRVASQGPIPDGSGSVQRRTDPSQAPSSIVTHNTVEKRPHLGLQYLTLGVHMTDSDEVGGKPAPDLRFARSSDFAGERVFCQGDRRRVTPASQQRDASAVN